MDHTILPKYQTIEIKKTLKFDSIMMFGIVFLDKKNLNLATKIALIGYLETKIS